MSIYRSLPATYREACPRFLRMLVKGVLYGRLITKPGREGKPSYSEKDLQQATLIPILADKASADHRAELM